MRTRYSRKPIAITAELEGFALRAHLALSYLQTSPPDFPRVLELACYVESAWLGASRHFQSPPKALAPARALLTDWLQALEGNGMAAPESVLDPATWQVLSQGVLCADGVWSRLPTPVLAEAMASVRELLAVE
ncbi:hypothetical protein [Chromobacterium amazonense]|uniref:hypothetical protein n=1 Tax=Chromobacterium amazonense TaxID=1382803 RepID=UPI0011B26622|nr:hypothetical protein [Chromobacterium amazonense]